MNGQHRPQPSPQAPCRRPRRPDFLRRAAYRLAGAVAEWKVRQSDLPMIRGLSSNLAVLYGLPEGGAELTQQVTENLRNLLECYTDLVRLGLSDPATVEASCVFDPQALAIIDGHLASGRGVLFVSPHMCSMDILLLVLGRRYPDLQVLSMPGPGMNNRLMNWLRSRHGLRMTPLSAASLREAVRRLQRGGLVGIAADLPAPESGPLVFLGRPCRLPLGFARLAISSGAAILVGDSLRMGPGRYKGTGWEVPKPAAGGGPHQVAKRWAQAVLEVMEGYIRARPNEWFMPQALWPASEALPASTQGLKLTSAGIRG